VRACDMLLHDGFTDIVGLHFRLKLAVADRHQPEREPVAALSQSVTRATNAIRRARTGTSRLLRAT
jgi:hypothetical protein